MKTREAWKEEALNFKGYTYEQILAVCQDIEKDIIDGHEEKPIRRKQRRRVRQTPI